MSLPTHRLFDRAAEASEFFATLAAEARVAVDLEADSLHSYREKICLVQISTPARTAIVDPLADPGMLDGLLPVLADPRVLKVFHGGDYDVRLLKRERGAEVRNLFDTMIAAQFTGRTRYGLAALLEEHFGVVLDKRFQKADWSRRPLTPELLAYAAADTAHLFGLADRLAADLARLGRTAWAEEEFRLLEKVEPAAARKPWCLDVKGSGRLAPRELARLQALLEMRDALASEWNRPPFKVLGNQLLTDWARQPPADRRGVLGTPGAGGPLLERIADRVLEALAAAEALPDAACPRAEVVRRQPLTPEQERRLARLKAARETLAGALGLEVGLLVNGATLERVAREEPPEGIAALPGVLKSWQLEAAGDALRRALQQ
jgi:ribonuclease D